MLPFMSRIRTTYTLMKHKRYFNNAGNKSTNRENTDEIGVVDAMRMVGSYIGGLVGGYYGFKCGVGLTIYIIRTSYASMRRNGNKTPLENLDVEKIPIKDHETNAIAIGGIIGFVPGMLCGIFAGHFIFESSVLGVILAVGHNIVKNR